MHPGANLQIVALPGRLAQREGVLVASPVSGLSVMMLVPVKIRVGSQNLRRGDILLTVSSMVMVHLQAAPSLRAGPHTY